MNPNESCVDGIARNLIRHAAGKAPAAFSERLREEWLADLTGRSGALSQLRFALGCCWATAVITREFGVPVRAAAAASGGKTTVIDDASPGRSFSRRTTVILVIVGFHILVVCVLATAIEAPNVFKPSSERIKVDFLPKPEPAQPPKPVDPTLRRISVEHLPPPAGPTERTERTITTEAQITEPPAARSVGPPSPTPVHRILGGPGEGFPSTEDYYPQGAIRQREMGSATVGVCVDAAGRLVGNPTINQSSGSARLDEGALRLAKAGSGHYRATTEDGRPVTACYAFRVRFQLRD